MLAVRSHQLRVFTKVTVGDEVQFQQLQSDPLLGPSRWSLCWHLEDNFQGREQCHSTDLYVSHPCQGHKFVQSYGNSLAGLFNPVKMHIRSARGVRDLTYCMVHGGHTFDEREETLSFNVHTRFTDTSNDSLCSDWG